MSEFVGRRAELETAEQALAALHRGDPGVVVIAGEPGIGKTRLIAEVLAEAERRRYVSLAGSGGELEGDIPFGVVADALDTYVAAVSAEALDSVAPDVISRLGAVLPSAASVEAPAAILTEERHRLYRAVGSLLERLAARRPIVVALDDLHWADAASVELVSYLLRHPPQAPVLILLGLRPHQAPARLRSILETAVRDGRCRWIELRALSATEAEALMGEGLDPEHRQALYSDSGGNPFYLLELKRASEQGRPGRPGQRRAAAPDEGPTDTGGIPRAVLSAIGDELSQLSVGARELLRAGAVVGDPFELDVAADVAGVSEEGVFQPLDELLEAQLLHPTETPCRFRFRHPVVRHAVYESAGRGWRLGAHRRAAATLAGRGAPPGLRAHHVERSARTGDEEAIALLVEAARSVATDAPATAARWFAAALRLLPEGPAAVGARLPLLAGRAAALASTGELEEAWAALVETLSLVPPEQTGLHAHLTAFCAAVEHLLGRHDEARARLRGALDEVEGPASAEAVGLQLELTADCVWMSDYIRMAEWAGRALEQAEELGDPVLIAAAVVHSALAKSCIGDGPGALRQGERARALVDALSDEELASRLDALMHLGYCEILIGRFHDAARHLERAAAVARATGQGAMLTLMLLGLAWANGLLGRLQTASEVLDATVEASRLNANPHNLFMTLGFQALVAASLGDRETASRARQEWLELRGRVQASVVSAAAGAHVAASLIEAGDPDVGVELMLDVLGGPEMPTLAPASRCIWYSWLTRGEIARDDVEKADEWRRRAHENAELLGVPFAKGLACLALAEVALARRDFSQAVEAALTAADCEEAAGARLDAARARMVAGRAFAGLGEQERATTEIVRAIEELSACGAKRSVDEASAELRRLGRRLPRRRREDYPTGIPGLTPRESEVANLVAQGKSNREIAAELFVSERTVENHLAHIFAKMGVSSRTALSAALGSAAPRSPGGTA